MKRVSDPLPAVLRGYSPLLLVVRGCNPLQSYINISYCRPLNAIYYLDMTLNPLLSFIV